MATSGTAYGNGVTIGSSVNNNYIFINWQLASQNPAANTSYINWQAYFHYTSSDAQLDDGDVSVNGSLRWDVPGRVKNFTGTYTTRDHGLASEGSFAIGHNTDGSKTFNINGSIGGSLSARSSASTNFDLPGFDRTPTTPSISGGTRDSSGTRFYTSSWSGSVNNSGPGVTWYLQYSTDNSNFYDYTSTTSSGAQLIINGLAATTTYYFRIKAVNVNATKYSGSITVYGAPTAPGKPVGTRSTSVAGRIDLTWPHVSSNLQVSQYDIYRNGSYINSTTGNWAPNSFADTTNLVRGSTYTYTVYGYNSSGWSAVSATSDPVMAPGIPGAPTLVASTELSPNPSRIGRNVTVRANKDANGYGNTVTEYRIQYATSDDNYATWYGWNGTSGVLNAYNPMNIAGAEATFTYNMLTAAKTYKFRVYAVNSIGSGDMVTLATPWFLPASGKRWNGTSWDPTAVAKRWNSVSGWADISTAKRYSSATGAWEELT